MAKLAFYVSRVLVKSPLILSRINGPNINPPVVAVDTMTNNQSAEEKVEQLGSTSGPRNYIHIKFTIYNRQ